MLSASYVALILTTAFAYEGPHGSPPLPWTYRDFEAWNANTSWQCGMPGQAPIDIDTARVQLDAAMGPLDCSYAGSTSAASLTTNTHTWMITYPLSEQKNNKIIFGGKDYLLTQFHFHSPSENTINGHHFDMEMHNVHVSADGQILVLALMMHAGEKPNMFFDSFFGKLLNKTTGSFPTDKDLEIPYKAFLPEEKSYYYFDGSLTTPPCTTGTPWILLQTPVTFSTAQRDRFRESINAVPNNQLLVRNQIPDGITLPWNATMGVDNRPVQPLGKRVVKLFSPSTHRQTEESGGFFTMKHVLLGSITLVSLVVFMKIISKARAQARESKELDVALTYNEL